MGLARSGIEKGSGTTAGVTSLLLVRQARVIDGRSCIRFLQRGHIFDLAVKIDVAVLVDDARRDDRVVAPGMDGRKSSAMDNSLTRS